MSLLNDLREKRDDLEARIALLVEERRPLGEQIGNIDRTLAKLRAEEADVRQRIKALTIAPSVSDHAVIRYLERKHGFCFEKVRDELLTPTVIEAMKAGGQSVKALGGTLKISGMKVVTYVP